MTQPMDVTCFGELLWDFFEADAKSDPKEPIARQFRREVGGASANVAIALARLGVNVAAAGGVGDDKLGEALRVALEADGVDVSHVVTLKARTGLSFVTRSATGEPTFFGYRQGTADCLVDESKITAASAKAKFVVLGTNAMLESTRPATEKFLAFAEKAKAGIVVDLNVRPQMWPSAEALRTAAAELTRRAVLVKASEDDLAAMAGKRGMTWLDEHAKQATWVLTRAENGAGAIGAHGQVTAPTKRVRCVDATGAGDAFLAGVIAVLIRGGAKPGSADWKDPKVWTKALEIGHLLGAKAVSCVGSVTGLVGLNDLQARIDGNRKG